MKLPHHLIIACALPIAAQALPVYPSAASVSGTDYWIYSETSPGTLTTNNAGSVLTELAGNASSPGGNVELFYSSELNTFNDPNAGGAFATVAQTTLDLTMPDGTTCQLSSLNGADWFTTTGGAYDTSYGADNLANQWFGDLLVASGQAAAINGFGYDDDLYNAMLAENVFADMSDPNISYAYMENGNLELGLGGHFDAGIKIDPILNDLDPTGALADMLPDPFQFSEIVLVDGEAHYGFAATDSGVFLDDGVNSYSGNYHLSIAKVPEPSSALLGLIAGAMALVRRRR